MAVILIETRTENLSRPRSRRKRSRSEKNKHSGDSNYMMEKCVWFGSGFYGLAGLWTFAVIEIGDVLQVIFNPSSIPESFGHGFVTAVVELVLN